MAKNKIKVESPPLSREILAVLGICIALFFLLCLVSYSFCDPPFQPGMGSLDNWGGVVGNWLAQALMTFLGISSYWLVFLFFFFSIQLFSPQASMARFPLIFAGCTGLIIASSGLWATFAMEEIVEIFGKVYPAGGLLGNIMHSFTGPHFGLPGGILFFSALFVISLMLAVRFSPYFCSMKIGEIITEIREYFRKPEKPKPAKKPSPKKEKDFFEIEDEPIEEELAPSLNAPIVVVEEPPEQEGVHEDEFLPLPVSGKSFKVPGISLLDKPDPVDLEVDREHYYSVSKQLEEKLRDFGVNGKVEGISPGPIVTTYEYAPAPGVKINRVASLVDDLALGLKVESVRIVGSVPGKAAIGIEIPNPERLIVNIRDIIGNDNFQKAASKLTLGLGKDVVGNPVIANLSKMPHLLIAGATGAGKSVAINTIICSMLMKATPDEVRLLMVDPKRIELTYYDDIPHLLHPVVDDPKMAARALQWAVREMERRYEIMKQNRVKNLAAYNAVAENKLPLIVIIIDELADLMMVSSREVEDSVTRLAQMARAAGMHLILATQRPSVDVLTGLIKANFPTRISFKVSSKIDSRTILDTSGAEHLLGMGDMLYLQPGSNRLKRVHGAYISEPEIENIVKFLKDQGTASYDESIVKIAEEPSENGVDDAEQDELYDQAVAMVCESGQASISMVQRRLRIGYNRAARMVETMEREGIIGPADGSKPREVLVRKDY